MTEIARAGEATAGDARAGQDTLIRTATTQGDGRSTTSRTAAYSRAAVSQGDGRSTTSRTAAYSRTGASTGEAGQSAASRALSLVRRTVSEGGVGRSVVSRAFADWAIEPTSTDPTMARVGADLTLSARTLSLSWPDSVDAWDRFDSAADIVTTEGAGGRFRIDRRDGGSTVQLEPPREQRPAVEVGAFVPSDFAATQLNQAVDEYQLQFSRPSPRALDGVSPLAESGDYTVTFDADGVTASLGLATQQVIESEISGSASGPEITVPLVLAPADLGTLAGICDRPSAVVERSVPDADSIREDTSPDSRQTTTWSTPADAPLADGQYLVAEWSASPIASESGRWETDVILVPIP